MTIRVLVVDDQAIVRDGLVTVLSLEPDVEVVGEAADGAAAVAMVDADPPDVVLMDLRMPGTDGRPPPRRSRPHTRGSPCSCSRPTPTTRRSSARCGPGRAGT